MSKKHPLAVKIVSDVMDNDLIGAKKAFDTAVLSIVGEKIEQRKAEVAVRLFDRPEPEEDVWSDETNPEPQEASTTSSQ